jgi:hypothetical protein
MKRGGCRKNQLFVTPRRSRNPIVQPKDEGRGWCGFTDHPNRALVYTRLSSEEAFYAKGTFLRERKGLPARMKRSGSLAALVMPTRGVI